MELTGDFPRGNRLKTIMKPALLFVATALLCAQVDPQGWANAHWGLTKQQLRSQLGAKYVSPQTRDSVTADLGLDLELAGTRFRAYLFVDEAFGLQMVLLKPTDKDFNTLMTLDDFDKIEAQIASKYGVAGQRNVNKKVVGDHVDFDAKVEWVLGTTQIILTYMNAHSAVTSDKGGLVPGPVIKSLEVTYKRITVNKF